MAQKKDISLWFFNGIQLLVNGVLILCAGIYQYYRPPQEEGRVVLFHLHAGIWWGALLTVLGLIYCLRFAPWREDASEHL